MGEALLILHLLAFPFLRSGTVVYLGETVVLLPPWEFQKYKIKRKQRLKSNTWQWQRLRICLNSLLIQGEKSFSLLKRILHYTRCTMTDSRLNDLALKALYPKRLSSALYWKNHWNVWASKSQKIVAYKSWWICRLSKF